MARRDLGEEKSVRAVRCVHCGAPDPPDGDHVPPRNLFPKPRPTNLVRVPACKECHGSAGDGGASKDEEYFLASFMFTEAGNSEAGRKLWEERVLRMYEKNRGLRSAVARTVRESELTTPAGIHLGRGLVQRLDLRRINRVAAKTVRGLYYFEFDEILDPAAVVQAMPLTRESGSKLESQRRHLKPGKRDWPGIFRYRRYRTSDDPMCSLWILQYYSFQAFMVVTWSQAVAARRGLANPALQPTPQSRRG